MSHPCCSTESVDSNDALAGLKLYQTFIFSVPIFFTFVLLFLFYLFYLRRRAAYWYSLQMRTALGNNNDLSRAELGLKKEVREMLPIIIYSESFSINDTLCSVCLGDYQAEDRLQQIPACGHTFHMDCIDSWLSQNTTCPLCRLSLLASAEHSTEMPSAQGGSETNQGHDHELHNVADSGANTILEQTRALQEPSSGNSGDEEEARSSQCVAPRENRSGDARNEMEKHEVSVQCHL